MFLRGPISKRSEREGNVRKKKEENSKLLLELDIRK